MFGWKARVGFISPGVHLCSQEWDQILPKGVVWVVATLGVCKLIPEEFEKVFDSYVPAAELLADRQVDFIICGGVPVHLCMGYEKGLAMAQRIEEITGIPTMWELTATVKALHKLSAKKIAIVTPMQEDRNLELRNAFEELGFNVLSIKGAGIQDNVELSNQPPYLTYRLAKEAIYEAPEAEAIYIHCPAWPAVSNVNILEKDFGKPVVTAIAGSLWAALDTLNIRAPVKDYGRLLEMV